MFIKQVERFVADYSEALGVDREAFIENMLIDYMARLSAQEQIGEPVRFPQFAKVDGNVLRGKELFDFMERYYLGELGAGESQEEDLKIMYERAEQKMKDGARLKEFQAEGLVPSDYYGPWGSAITYCEQFKRGEIDRERLDHILNKYKRDEGRG